MAEEQYMHFVTCLLHKQQTLSILGSCKGLVQVVSLGCPPKAADAVNIPFY